MGKKAKIGKTRKDKYYQLAKETGFRSRAAFKLIQLNRKFGFLQKSQVCLDLCAAPGGWMQVAKQNMPVSSIVIGVDLYPIRPIAGCITIIEDITTEKCRQSLAKELQNWKVDVVLHDGAPNVGRNWLHDSYQQICLTLSALKLGVHFLRRGGCFITKVFRSKDYNALLWVFKQLFKKVHATKPSASRKESAEIFVVCEGFLAPDRIDPRLLDSKYVFEDFAFDGKKYNNLLQPDNQKRVKAEGYTENDILLRNELSAKAFMLAENGLATLQGVSSIIIDDDRIANHPKTQIEILECCKDIKVLGRRDIKGLMSWRNCIKKDIFDDKKEQNEVTIEDKRISEPLTTKDLEDIENEKLQEEIYDLLNEDQKDLNRKRKKTKKIKLKLQKKLNLNMIIKGDEGPHEQSEPDIFALKSIETREELDDMLDVAPDCNTIEDVNESKLPKYKRYKKMDQLDEDAYYGSGSRPAILLDEEFNYGGFEFKELELTDETQTENIKFITKQKQPHPLINSDDFRDKNTKRVNRVHLWFEKENFQKIDREDDEDYDLKSLALSYKQKGVSVFNEKSDLNIYNSDKMAKDSRSKHTENLVTSTDNIISTTEKVPSKIHLNKEELGLGSIIMKGQKIRRNLIDNAWNRYSFNDEYLPHWFTKDEEMHMRKPLLIPKELSDEYERKVQELNVRPIKKMMEAKARKKRQAQKRLARAKKQADKIIENADVTNQEKARQLRNIYKKVDQKKKSIAYVVAKKHQAGQKLKRPSGVKGRYRVVDPRQKKDKRAFQAKEAKKKSKGRK